MTLKKSAQRGPVKLAYSYRRYSSQNQTDGSSLERQLELAQSVCNEREWKLVDLPPDAGVSAYSVSDGQQMAANFHKGTLGAFVKKVKRGEIAKGSVLILERLDRFSRNYFDIVFPVWLELLQSGLEIFSCVTRTHYTLQTIRDNPMLAGMALMELANANEYSRGMGKRIANAFDIRISLCKQGQKMNLGGWVPKWFDFIGEAKKAGEYRPNKHFPTIQRICNEYIAGRSMYQIARGLIADDTPTVMGGKWAQGTIANLLRHRTLLGTLEHKGLTIPNFYPPVLTKPQWDKLQAKLNENKARKGGGAGSDIVANLFRNRCKCVCGATITTARSSSDRIYTCKA
jgi:hypothetical protein